MGLGRQRPGGEVDVLAGAHARGPDRLGPAARDDLVVGLGDLAAEVDRDVGDDEVPHRVVVADRAREPLVAHLLEVREVDGVVDVAVVVHVPPADFDALLVHGRAMLPVRRDAKGPPDVRRPFDPARGDGFAVYDASAVDDSREKRVSSSAWVSPRSKRGSSAAAAGAVSGSLKYSVARYDPATPAPSARSAQAVPLSFGNIAESTDGLPGPLSASATIAAIRTALYS